MRKMIDEGYAQKILERFQVLGRRIGKLIYLNQLEKDLRTYRKMIENRKYD